MAKLLYSATHPYVKAPASSLPQLSPQSEHTEQGCASVAPSTWGRGPGAGEPTAGAPGPAVWTRSGQRALFTRLAMFCGLCNNKLGERRLPSPVLSRALPGCRSKAQPPLRAASEGHSRLPTRPRACSFAWAYLCAPQRPISGCAERRSPAAAAPSRWLPARGGAAAAAAAASC